LWIRASTAYIWKPRDGRIFAARAGLLDARGCQTLCAEQNPDDDPTGPSNTLIQNRDGVNPADLDCWLSDDEFIYPLKVGLNTVGRAPENDVVVADAFISRRHCAILVHSGRVCELHDIASKNGTFLNGAKLGGPTPLKTGDQIRICERNFLFVSRHDKRRGLGATLTLSS
jgi:hypothetical protein